MVQSKVSLSRIERAWDAIVLVHSWQRWQPPPTIEAFVERLPDRSKLVVLTTSGSGESRMACVDAVTSASQLSRTRGDGEDLFGRIERVLDPTRPRAKRARPERVRPSPLPH